MHPPRPNLLTLGRADLARIVAEAGQPAFRTGQIVRWIWNRGARSLDEMTNVPAALRQHLAERFRLESLPITRLQRATDRTLKALIRLDSGRQVETVLIPDFDADGAAKRLTVCVSSQVGCAMACSFCATGTMGFHQNLTPGEIAGQVAAMDALAHEHFGAGVTNVVFMGMGEPMLNLNSVVAALDLMTADDALGLSAKKITVSTVGLARRIRDFADLDLKVRLAVSLHAPDDVKRSRIMPVNRSEATDLTALREALQHYYRTTGLRVTYEYCMFAGYNDSPNDARALARVSGWVPSKVNLIMYNPVKGLDFQPSDEATLDRFLGILAEKGVTATVRRSRGQDIDAACGQLAVSDA
jgi:23S rRNA (adenine2503-C2)-methyltransferase